MTTFSLALLCQASILASTADTYTEAYHASTKTGRPMVVMVSAEWCPACRTMKKEVIPQVEEKGLLGKVSFAMVNLDRQQELGRKLTRGGPIPQLLMFRRTAEGWRLSRLTGRQSVRKVEAFIDRGLERDATEKKAGMARKGPPSEKTAATEGDQAEGPARLTSLPQGTTHPTSPK
ncbi:MAG: thioredoxin family protein [Planctomycetota bacterium]